MLKIDYRNKDDDPKNWSIFVGILQIIGAMIIVTLGAWGVAYVIGG
jgi:hypothetical protein